MYFVTCGMFPSLQQGTCYTTAFCGIFQTCRLKVKYHIHIIRANTNWIFCENSKHNFFYHKWVSMLFVQQWGKDFCTIIPDQEILHLRPKCAKGTTGKILN